MIILALLVVLIFIISSVSSVVVNNTSDVKLVKSTSKTTDSSKVKTNATKVTSTKTTTVNKKTLAKTSTSFMKSVEKNGKLPKVKISNRNYSHTEYLYLISKSVENESKSKIEIKNKLVKPYTNTKSKCVKGTINKTEYVKIAGKTRKFIEQNKRAPNWASSSKGNIPYNQLILMFSKCLDNYNKTNNLPASIKLDDLDLDKINSKVNSAKATLVKKTNASSTKKANATKTTAKASSTKKANATKTTAKASSTKKTNTTKTVKTSTTTSKKTAGTNGNAANNRSLLEKSIDYVYNVLNSILDKLDPSKYKLEASRSAEANVKFNISKAKVDMNGKSNISLKISPKTIKLVSSKSKTSSSKKNATTSSAKKTTTSSTKTTAKKTTNSTKKTTANSIAKALKKYLVSSKNCQVNNKQIKAFAKSLTKSLKTDYQKAKKIFTWVRDHITYKKYSNTLRGALKTLKSRKGNCVDQSHLLIALSRAAGIPARYVNGGNCKFTSGYVSGHVWAQLYIKNKWVVADTTSYRNSLGKIKNWNTKSYTHYGEYSSISF